MTAERIGYSYMAYNEDSMYHGSHHLRTLHTKRHAYLSFAVLLALVAVLIGAGFAVQAPWPILGNALLISVVRLLAAYVISLILGVTIALLVSLSSWGDDLLPLFDVLQNIPSFALIPVFTILLGTGTAMIVTFAATSIIWPIMFYATSAMQTVRQEEQDAATIFGATGFKRVWSFLLPLSFPALVTGSMVGVSIGWEAVIGGEIITHAQGIGTMLDTAGAAHDSGILTVGILLLLIFVFLISRLLWIPLLKKSRQYAD